MSQITSHILDTTSGKPAHGVTIILFIGGNDEWVELCRGLTDADGRVKDLEVSEPVQQAIYKLRFETKDYFDKSQIKTFYPYIEIIFEIDSTDHYHVPLLLNPYGYSTYRGS